MDYLKTLYTSMRALLVATAMSGSASSSIQAQSTPMPAQTPDRERELWDQAKASGKPEAYQNYLDSYPFGRHAADAFRELVTSTLGNSRNVEPGAGATGRSGSVPSGQSLDLY